MNSGILSKLPRPTRSLAPYGGRSLLEGGALPQRQCAPRPHAWTRPGFLFPSCHRHGCVFDTSHSDRRRGLSRRFNSRCSLALPQNGDGEAKGVTFAVVVPEYRVRYSRTTGASLLMAPTVLGLCQGSSRLSYGFGCIKPSRTGFLSSRLTSFGEEGGSTLPNAESCTRYCCLPCCASTIDTPLDLACPVVNFDPIK